MKLQKDNISLRLPEPNDVDFILDCENNTDNWKISQTLIPFSRNTIEQYVNSSHDILLQKQVRFIIENDGNRVGTLDLFEYDPVNSKVGVGILVADSSQRGHGIGKLSLALVIDYCKEHLMVHSIFCNILESNVISIGLFEQAGFKLSGTKKDWVRTQDGYENELFYQLING